MKIKVTKGKEKKNGMFIWSICIVGKGGKDWTSELPAGTVLARTKVVAKKKASIKIRETFKGV